MDVRIPLLSRRAGWLESGTVVVVCGLLVAVLSAGELAPVAGDLITVVAAIASVIGLVLLQIWIGMCHVDSGDSASVVLLIAGIAAWAFAVLFATFGGPVMSLLVTAVSAILLLSAVRRIAQPTVHSAAS
ncbi:hypothetical protein [Rhodococcus sp. 1163]|uniref:hypothetical protein n=1 Tax=Rhodococcus sp. 1163 TaxID=1905289 RepID=UPI00117AC8E3|nr:hypothetical protein [Rhodococcus sp. 1163]